LQGLLAQINASGAGNQASLTGQQQQILGRLGETIDPSRLPAGIAGRLGNLGAALTPELSGVVDAANQSGVSTLAQLARQYQRAQSASAGDLAARGIIRSGAYGQHAADNLHDYTLGQYQARQSALDALGGLQSSFTQQQQDLAGQAGSATNDALGRLTDQIRAGLVAPPTSAPGAAPLPPAVPRAAVPAIPKRAAAPVWGSQRTTRAL
jgi:hypothetical protein